MPARSAGKGNPCWRCGLVRRTEKCLKNYVSRLNSAAVIADQKNNFPCGHIFRAVFMAEPQASFYTCAKARRPRRFGERTRGFG
jgi:hypothetical protein